MFARRRNRAAGKATLAAVALTTLVAGLLLPVQAAHGAPGDLDTSISFVDNPAGAPITELRATMTGRTEAAETLFGLNIGYSCGGTTACTGTVITLSPMPLDPYYGTKRFADYSSVTLPSGATLGGNATTGYTVTLGTLAAGSSGSFTILFRYQHRPVGVSSQSFFPDGHVIGASATISATNQSSTTRSDSVVWRISTPTAAVAFTPNAATVPAVARVGEDYAYSLYLSARCLWERTTAGHGEPMYECASEYSATQTLPAGVDFVSASHGGVYNSATNTVTWSDSGITAASGWGSLNNLGTPRKVVVRFPQSLFTDPNECVISATSTFQASVKYLAGSTQTASTSQTNEVNSCTPFSSATLTKFSSRSTGSASDPIVWAGTDQAWTTRITHRGNVPGVATVTDTALDQPGLAVYRITMPTAGSMTVTLDNGTVATVNTTNYVAPTGRRIVSATVVTPPIAGPNKVVGNQALSNTFDIRYHYTVQAVVPDAGFQRTNTASATMAYPGTPALTTANLGAASETVTAYPKPAVLSPSITRVVTGGGNPVAGTEVTFTMRGSTSSQDAGVAFIPQYVFVAPVNWTITPGSASIPGLTGAVIEYKTVTIAGESRQAVYVTDAPGVVWGVNSTWPNLTVKATPGAGATAGTVSRADFYQGDANHNYGPTTAIWGATAGTTFGAHRFVDAPDLDGDGVTTESFAGTYVDTTIGAASALTMQKSICRTDLLQPDGCNWVSDSSTPFSVSPLVTSVKYRVTFTNTGSTNVSNLVAYDVLPVAGDTGTTVAGAGTTRGSTTSVTFANIVSTSGGLTVHGSAAPDTCRPELGVATNCNSVWLVPMPGDKALKFDYPASLAPGAAVSAVFNATISPLAVAGDLACNSVAVAATGIPATESRTVCLQVDAADLQVSIPNHLPLQTDRPGVVPFTVLHGAGSATSRVSVTIPVPAGLTVTSLTPLGWACTAPSAPPVAGPAALTCKPVDEFGVERSLARGVSDSLALDVIPTEVFTALCVAATVSGPLHDPNASNNTASSCAAVVPGLPAIEVGKDDGRTAVTVGDEYNYTIRVSNLLVGESVNDITVTDQLPSGLVFVSASNGGTVSARDADDGFGNLPGGVVTWTIPTLAPSGIASATGETATGAEAAVVALTVRVRVAPLATGSVTNSVHVETVDPGDPTIVVEDDATDTDTVTAALDPTITKTVTSFAHRNDGSWDVVYRIRVTNPNLTVPVSYGLSDAMRYPVAIGGDASVTASPAGVTLSTWAGSGTIVSSEVLPANSQHDYTITTVVNGGAIPGTAAAECVAESASGFANVATLSLRGGRTATAEACASPVVPGITKTMVGSPVQNVDGTWTVSYLITVSNPHATPSSGLYYYLLDELAFPAGVEVISVATTNSGGPFDNPSFNGGLTTVNGATVTASAYVFYGMALIPAGTVATPQTHEYRVDVRVNASEAALTDAQLSCANTASGYRNGVSLKFNSEVVASATACADIQVPKLRFTKTADRSGLLERGSVVTYTVTAENVGDGDFTTGAPAALRDDLSRVIDDARYNNDASASAGVVVQHGSTLRWSGPIPAGDSVTIRYSVRTFDTVQGDAELVNLVARDGATIPPTGVAACTASSSTNAAPCHVTLQLDTKALATTGADARGVLLATGFALLLLLLGTSLVGAQRARRSTI